MTWQTTTTGKDGGNTPITIGSTHTGFSALHGFKTEYGSELFNGLGDRLGGTVVIHADKPWDVLQHSYGRAPVMAIEANDLSPAQLDDWARSVPENVTIVGVGGGSAMDVAKWIHWRRQLPLVQVPTLASVDACFTRMSALRDQNKVRYEGDAVPDVVLVDYAILQAAPSAFISAGIGDVLSCHTALADWRFAVSKGESHPWNDQAAGASLRFVDGLEKSASGIKDQSEEGIRSLMELHREIGWLCHDLQHARFEEGSEHFFAYAFEQVTGRTILHGELVSLGVLIMTAVFDNDYARVKRIVTACGTRHGLDELGIKWEEIEATLKILQKFSIDGGYWYSYAHSRNFGEKEIEIARKALDF